jgi:cytochrome c553
MLRSSLIRARSGSRDFPKARLPVALAVLLCGVSTVRAEDAAAPPSEHVEFFEQHVRPLLAEKCWSCHGSQKQQGGLRLDSRAALLKGNDSGPGIDMQNRAASRILQVIAYSGDDVQMPPQGKLPDQQVASIIRWVELGAPWPEKVATPHSTAGANGSATQNHWAYQPMRSAEPPTVGNIDRVQTPIDAFIVSALDAQGLSIAPPAKRATFIRRATLDLWGLPPTYAEVQEFVHDDRPDAVDRLIDRLLASPRYGERWARYWLDIARYADTKGYVFTAEPRYPYAYTYRDYVIDAFNADKPYDRFVLEQLAADQLEQIDSPKTLAALGFLTVGRRFLNKNEDIIDDRIDVVCRGLMALTVGCARCHDHKFDPVPTADYYSLYGVFASCSEPDDLPIIGEPSERAEHEKFVEELTKRQQKLADFEQKTRDNVGQECRTKITAYLELVVQPVPSNPRNAFRSLSTGDPRPQIVQRWRDYLNVRAKSHDPVFGPWRQWADKTGDEFASAVQSWCADAIQPGRFDAGDDRVNLLVRQALLEHAPSTPVELARVYGGLLAEVHQHWKTWKAEHAEATALADPNEEELRQLLYADGTPTVLAAEDAKSRIFNRAERDKQRELQKQIDAWQATSAGAPPRAMVLRDQQRPMEPRVFIRGNSGRPGPQVPRQFLEVVAGPERKPFAHGSGRLELGQAIVDRNNPLTARVIVNRVWQNHFGKGLVRTPGDFGVRGEAPTHPELLDYLALRLIDSGWSLKELHREIMSSAAYQQSSVGDATTAKTVDPENRLLWQMPRRRLDLEAVRDSWLAAASALDERNGGRPFDSISDPQQHRRTIYGLVNRNDLPGVFRVFDFADPDASAPERPQTTVPQQALFGMNSTFLRENARRLAAGIPNDATNDAERVAALYRQALSRDPDSLEREQALDFVRTAGTEGKMSAWERLAQVLLLTNEFAFVD